MARADPQMKIRLPTALKTQLAEVATRSGRSLNAEIVVRLTASFQLSDEAAVPDFLTPETVQAILETRAIVAEIVDQMRGSEETPPARVRK